MRTVLPGRPPPKHQALSTALWNGLRVIGYVSGNAFSLLRGPYEIFQTIYVDDVKSLEAITIEESSGTIAVCGGENVYIYKPYGREQDVLKWAQAHVLMSDEFENPPKTLSWGSSEELLVGGKAFALWDLTDAAKPVKIWSQALASEVQFADFSPDGALVASSAHFDHFVKIWRRLSYEAGNIRFDVSYLQHPGKITRMHWRRPWHVEQDIDNLLYTICEDNKIRIWIHTDHHALATMQLSNLIDMAASIQPRRLSVGSISRQRYGFIIDSRDFTTAIENAVQNSSNADPDHALEHLVEIATRSPEICVVLDGRGHMSAWGLENAGYKNKRPAGLFNIAHVEGMNIPFSKHGISEEDYAQFCVFAGATPAASLTILVHYYDGRIDWFDTQISQFLHNGFNDKRTRFRASWDGHHTTVDKVVRDCEGTTTMSLADGDDAIIWRAQRSNSNLQLVRQSALISDDPIRDSLILAKGRSVVNLHDRSISLWDTTDPTALKIASRQLSKSASPLFLVHLPAEEHQIRIATFDEDLYGEIFRIHLPISHEIDRSGLNGHATSLQKVGGFYIEDIRDLSLIVPIELTGFQETPNRPLLSSSPFVAITISKGGLVSFLTEKLDAEGRSIGWGFAGTMETGTSKPSNASACSTKVALVNQDRTSLTIWDFHSKLLEYELKASEFEYIQRLKWTSTREGESILCVEYTHRQELLLQSKYDYLLHKPAWYAFRAFHQREVNPQPLGDSCWLANGHLLLAAGHQLFIYNRHYLASDLVRDELRLGPDELQSEDIFEVARMLNASLPVFHPQLIEQLVLLGKINLVHSILLALLQSLKFVTNGHEIADFLDFAIEDFLEDKRPTARSIPKDAQIPYSYFFVDGEAGIVNEKAASEFEEKLKDHVNLPQMSRFEEAYLTCITRVVGVIQKQLRSVDPNASRYLYHFHKSLLHKDHRTNTTTPTSWRGIVFAIHSNSQDILADTVSSAYSGKMLWPDARTSGLFMWLLDDAALRTQLEIIARNEYTRSEDRSPISCSLFYLALRKKSILQGLWRISYTREQTATLRLLANDFTEQRWKTTALKNAYALLSKRRFEYAAAFFLLGDALQDAVDVCVNQLGDMQLAVAIARAYDGDESPVLRKLIQATILPAAVENGDRWQASWACWMLGRHDLALKATFAPLHTLLPSGSRHEVLMKARSFRSADPALLVLYRQLRESVLLEEKNMPADTVSPHEEWDFVLATARTYARMGCDVLALDLLRSWNFTLPISAQEKSGHGIGVGAENRTGGAKGEENSHGDPSGDEEDVPKKQIPLEKGKEKKPAPTQFHEPSASSLLDSFGF